MRTPEVFDTTVDFYNHNGEVVVNEKIEFFKEDDEYIVILQNDLPPTVSDPLTDIYETLWSEGFKPKKVCFMKKYKMV